MAKRKSTDKSSKPGLEDNAGTKEVSDALDAADVAPDTNDNPDESVAAKLDDAIYDETLGASDDAIKLAEPVENADTISETSDTTKTPLDDTVESTGDSVEPSDKETVESADAVEEVDLSTETNVTIADHLSEEEAERLLEEAETVEASTDRADTVKDIPKPSSDGDPAAVAPQVIRETVVEQKGGFAPLLLGGVVAAVLGYGVAAYTSQSVWPFASPVDDSFEVEMRDTLSAQSGSLDEVTARLTTLEGVEPPVVDLSPLQSDIAGVQETIAGAVEQLTAQLDEIAARVETLEKQPMEQAVSPEAIAAYEKALSDMQAEVEAQRAEVAQMAAQAMAAEGNAEEKAQLAAARAALADVTTALATGSEFTEAIDVLSANAVEVPPALTANSENGIATQAALIESFAEAARAALSAARSDATENAEGTNRVASFFANQLGARSVAPKEGDDPDAVLSRAEALVRSGDIEAALSELTALPEVAQSALAEWKASASTRLEAKSAVDALVQQLLQE